MGEKQRVSLNMHNLNGWDSSPGGRQWTKLLAFEIILLKQKHTHVPPCSLILCSYGPSVAPLKNSTNFYFHVNIAFVTLVVSKEREKKKSPATANSNGNGNPFSLKGNECIVHNLSNLAAFGFVFKKFIANEERTQMFVPAFEAFFCRLVPSGVCSIFRSFERMCVCGSP